MPTRPLSAPVGFENVFDPHTPHGHGKPGAPKPNFARSENTEYRSAGLKLHLEAAATSQGFTDRSLFGQVENSWFVKQAQNSLGYIANYSDPAVQQPFIDRATAMRDALAVALAGLESAIVEAAAANHLPPPPFVVAAASKPTATQIEVKEPTDGAGQLCGPVAPGIGSDLGPATGKRPRRHGRALDRR